MKLINPQTQSSGYLVYTALLNQSGTSAPVATVLENTIGDIVWTREGTGVYRANLAGAFTTNKTWWDAGQNVEFSHVRIGFLFIDPNSIELMVQEQTVTFSGQEFIEQNVDGALMNTPVELRIYP